MKTIERKLNNASVFGSNVTMLLHYKDGAKTPCCSEIFSNNGDPDLHAEIGLWWEERELIGFDGAFFFPKELRSWLTELGLDVETYLKPGDELLAIK